MGWCLSLNKRSNPPEVPLARRLLLDWGVLVNLHQRLADSLNKNKKLYPLFEWGFQKAPRLRGIEWYLVYVVEQRNEFCCQAHILDLQTMLEGLVEDKQQDFGGNHRKMFKNQQEKPHFWHKRGDRGTFVRSQLFRRHRSHEFLENPHDFQKNQL